MSNQYVTVQDGDYYGVPYRCLVPLKVENLLVAGGAFPRQARRQARFA